MSEPFPPPPGSAPPPPILRGPAPGLEYAGFGIRLVALIIDGIIIGIIQGGVGLILGLGFIGYYGIGPAEPFGFRFGAAWFVYALVTAAISGFYFVYTWTHGAASPGQRVMNLQVRRLADGSQLSQDSAIRRWAFLTLPVLNAIPLLGFLVFLYNLYLAYTTANDPRHQGFHDKQVDSVVVRPTP